MINAGNSGFLLRGAGCIFVEMITGIALFPGTGDYITQLNKIWQVRNDSFVTS